MGRASIIERPKGAVDGLTLRFERLDVGLFQHDIATQWPCTPAAIGSMEARRWVNASQAQHYREAIAKAVAERSANTEAAKATLDAMVAAERVK